MPWSRAANRSSFNDVPSSLLGSRGRVMSKVLGNLSRGEQFDPPLLQALQ
jgi:hypothetical protein